MTDDIQEGLEDARRHVQVARDLLDRGDADDVAASRAYYAMFYAAEAALLSLNLSFSKHQGVIAAFGKQFAKTHRLPPELHGHLREAFELRQTADYTRGDSVAPEDASLAVERAERFIDAIEQYLRGQEEHDRGQP